MISEWFGRVLKLEDRHNAYRDDQSARDTKATIAKQIVALFIPSASERWS